MDKQTREKLTEVLMLIEQNGRISASRAGLEGRAENRAAAASILCDLLGIEGLALDSLYDEWIAMRGEGLGEIGHS